MRDLTLSAFVQETQWCGFLSLLDYSSEIKAGDLYLIDWYILMSIVSPDPAQVVYLSLF